jgi:DNA-binding CsgD family transcriptional regulator
LNRPTGRIRSIALLAAVTLMYPLFLLWDIIALFLSRYYQNIQIGTNFDDTIFFISLMIEAVILLAFVFLGANRSRMFVPAAFVLSLFQVIMITVNYFFAAVFLPLVAAKKMYEIAYQFPHTFDINLFSNVIIIVVCCLLAARWLRDTRIKPPFKFYSLFSMVFIIISLIVTVWWINVRDNESGHFWAYTFLGALILGVLLFLFYLYTRLIGTDNKADIVINKTEEAEIYAQLIQRLSRRELEVVEAVLAGNKDRKELARALNISVNTVKTHLSHIYQVTGVSNIAGLLFLFRGHK